jgi:hypothetical protein
MNNCPICNKPPSARFRWCDECVLKMRLDIQALFNLLEKQHRGAGGSAICICGAGCGGTKECRALGLLKTAIEGRDVIRMEIAELFGWNAY